MRTLSTLLSLGYYALVVTIRVVFIHNDNRYNPVRKRAIRDLRLALLAIPIFIVILIITDDFPPKKPNEAQLQDTLEVDTVHRLPSASDSLAFAHPNAR